MKLINKFLKQLFCRHDYTYLKSEYKAIYKIKSYICLKCGKFKKILRKLGVY